jgi:hypothetical protein
MGIALASMTSAVNTSAQTARITGVSTVQYVQFRPLVTDSVPVEATTGEGLIRRTVDGLLVRCITGERVCRGTRAGARGDVLPVIQDITVSAWGFGRGIRVQAQLRSRMAVGGDASLWPRADDAFDALTAFIEIDRPVFRVRAGRQWKVSGLGYYNFDGATLLVRALPDLSAEVWGGWSLARGTNEPRTSDALAAIEPFAPDKRALLFGTQLSYRPHPSFSASALYQREIRSDRLGLYTERASLDAVWRSQPLNVSGSLEADVATREFSEARLLARVLLTDAFTGRASLRRYRPFFELWTIWGAFDPVGFNEAAAGASIRSSGGIDIDLDVSRRAYDATNTSTVFGDYRTGGWVAAVNAGWSVTTEWLLQGDYRVEFGFGAARSEVGGRVQRTLSPNTVLGLSALAFQRQFEFRVAEGTVYGLGADGRVRLGQRTRLNGSLAMYRHSGGVDASGVDWSQVRGLVQLEWTVGSEPGIAGAAGGGR